MDKISADLLDRIRTAVIKKLREMECYVDNELPDYIMILVANKRTLAHMQKDLSLFLGKHTSDFTLWLFDMIAHLKKSSSNANRSLKIEKSKENLDISEEDADVLDYDIGDQEGDLLDPDDNSLSTKPSTSGDSLKSKMRELTGLMRSEDAIGSLSRQHTTQKSAKVYPVQPFCRSTKPSISSEQQPPEFQTSILDEYDPTKPEFTSSVSSVVRSMRTGFSKPPALQTNKLLLRAVDDATKSIRDNKNMSRYKPTPIKVLASTKHESFGSRSRNLVSVKIDPSLNLDTNPVMDYSEASTIDMSEQETKMNVFESDAYVPSGIGNYNRTICLSSEQSKMNPDVQFHMNEYSAVDASFQVNEYTAVDASFQMNEYTEVDTSFHMKENSPVDGEQQKGKKPHFIVTLDGVNLPSFKRKFSDSEESMDAEEDEYELDEELDTNQKKQKVAERCKYWPSCKNSDDCAYYHPSIPCKSFPDCRYGDKCLFIHPNCKFDSRCSRKDCPYTHTIKKKFPLPLVATKRPVNVRGFKTVCKFFPKCTVKNCAFVHPKLCRFGTKCRLQTCLFTHVSIPPRNQMKWKANVSEDM